MLLPNPTKLAELQDSIISKGSISVDEANQYISQLFQFSSIVNNSFLGFNAVAENNLAIRYHFIQSALHKIIGSITRSEVFFKNAFYLLTNYMVNGFYIEGLSYFLYVKQAYLFLLKFLPEKELPVFKNVEDNYSKIAAPTGQIPTTDTYFSEMIKNPSAGSIYTNSYYSAHRSNGAYIFVNHFDKLNSFSKNLHINYEFGHFCLYSDNEWKIIHPWYSGFKSKSDSFIKNSWNNNIIVDGLRTEEPYWRYLPFKPKLSHKYFNSFSSEKTDNHQFEIGDNTRKIEITEHVISVIDQGGEYSSFNLSDTCRFNVLQASKVEEGTGYHSENANQVSKHKRLKIYGKERKIVFLF